MEIKALFKYLPLERQWVDYASMHRYAGWGILQLVAGAVVGEDDV